MDLSERGPTMTRHPWEVSRAKHFVRVLQEHMVLEGVTGLLDIGAGDSWFAAGVASRLAPGAQVVCWDVHYDDADLADPPPGVRRVREAPRGTFPIVTALDVLEHVVDDDRFLAEQLVPSLTADGWALISVPAHPRLFSHHDEMLGHHRRYTTTGFTALLERHLRVAAVGSLFTSLVPPRVAAVGLERLGRRRPEVGVGDWKGGPGLTSAVTNLLDADAALGRWLARHGRPLPGLSVWALGRPR